MNSIFPFLVPALIPVTRDYTTPEFSPKRTKRKYWMTSKKGYFGGGRKKRNRK